MSLNKLNNNYIMYKSGKNISFFDPDNSIIFKLNNTAAIIFKNLTKGNTNQEIVEKIVKLYDISPDRAINDVEFFTNYLFDKRILIK